MDFKDRYIEDEEGKSIRERSKESREGDGREEVKETSFREDAEE